MQFGDCTKPVCYDDAIGEVEGFAVMQVYENLLDWKRFCKVEDCMGREMEGQKIGVTGVSG